MGDITKLQDDIEELQLNFAEDLISENVDTDTAEQLAMQSTLTVLSDRMATIQMKASGKQQLLEVCIHFTDCSSVVLFFLSFCYHYLFSAQDVVLIFNYILGTRLIRVAVLCFRID